MKCFESVSDRGGGTPAANQLLAGVCASAAPPLLLTLGDEYQDVGGGGCEEDSQVAGGILHADFGLVVSRHGERPEWPSAGASL